MKRLLVLMLLASMPAFAQDPAASEASIRELMTITNSRALLDQTYGQLDSLMENAMKEALGGKKVSAEQEKLLAEFRAEMVTLVREEMSWEDLEPSYLQLYTSTFSQSEVDGMLAFYKSPPGQAVIAKMPLLMQNIMQVVMGRMQQLMPKIQALQNEFKGKVAAAKD